MVGGGSRYIHVTVCRNILLRASSFLTQTLRKEGTHVDHVAHIVIVGFHVEGTCTGL